MVFGVSAEAKEGKRVGDSAINLLARTIVRLPGQLMRAFYVLIKLKAEPGEIRRDRRLVGRTLVKALKNLVKLPCFILRSVKPAKRLKRLTPHRRVFRDALPEFLGFVLEFPFRGHACERQFMFRLFIC
ncbi:MAG: hypothetical protein DME52_07385 [Verrucomicrobia bacterium]|nr:MAG: hypothetical protein DME52_07385 [Verrucomicrobiota bacterium]